MTGDKGLSTLFSRYARKSFVYPLLYPLWGYGYVQKAQATVSEGKKKEIEDKTYLEIESEAKGTVSFAHTFAYALLTCFRLSPLVKETVGKLS